ncbi:MAG TPA: hypothetical protein VHF47_00020 [Acidimicrobiales bacterium]|nr:hypothetical protein [Acidimicrobiales bacterium]
MDPTEAERLTIAGQLGFWALAVEVERERVTDRSGGQFQNELDARLLVLAIRNVIRAVGWAGKYEPAAVKRALADFVVRVPNAVAVRDILEHFDEYEAGGGRRKVTGYGIFTVRYENEYLLRVSDDLALDVNSAANATTALADALQEVLIGRCERPAL